MTATAAAPVRAGARPARRGPSLPRVVAAEWTKLTSLRSPAAIGVVTVTVSGVLTWLSANASSTDPGFDPTGSLGTGLPLAQVGLLVLGVLVATGEFSTGTFRTTFTAVPRRLPVLVAQLVVTAAAALVVSVLAVAAAVVGLLPAAGSRGMTLDLAGGGTPQLLVGMTLQLVAMALLGLALGALLRRTVPAVVAAVVLVLVLPVALMLASDPGLGGAPPVGVEYTEPEVTAVSTVTAVLPGGAVTYLVPDAGGVPGAPDLGVGGGVAVLAAWVLVPLGVAAVRLRARDLV
ncbi:ABC transporter permease subunit [Cellulomonas cellasea]|uniref:ABC-2 type transport system permease protein n=1 Tax=Cellulomonas cellasea TaxID=43670 RepID=A0A7W4UJ29_9CELL|nr:ABC transporter permease subunit [Cellulomonas cellasea]MBB2924453.1 ABC-2 type transport system permease protein [Cellulomonas cellasea]